MNEVPLTFHRPPQASYPGRAPSHAHARQAHGSGVPTASIARSLAPSTPSPPFSHLHRSAKRKENSPGRLKPYARCLSQSQRQTAEQSLRQVISHRKSSAFQNLSITGFAYIDFGGCSSPQLRPSQLRSTPRLQCSCRNCGVGRSDRSIDQSLMDRARGTSLRLIPLPFAYVR